MKLETELIRGAGPVAVLKLLERRAMYGYEMIETLSKRSIGVLAMGESTLYPMLYNLEAKGLIAPSWKQEEGRERKYYALTAKGRRRLAEDLAQWRSLVKALGALGVVSKAPNAASAGGIA